MKYTKEITDKLLIDYAQNRPIREMALELSVPERSIIAKLSSLGVYKKKTYVNKRGEIPTKKSVHIENIAKLLNMDLELCESLEKVNKLILVAIERALSPTSSPEVDLGASDPKSEQF